MILYTGSRMLCKKNLKTWRGTYWGLDLSFISWIFVIHISLHSPLKRMDRVLLVTLLWCAAVSIAARFQPRSLVDLEAEEASAPDFFFI